MSDRALTYRDPVFHFVALREGGTIATGNERGVLIREPAHVHSAHAALCCWGKLSDHSQPALRTGLMAPQLELEKVAQFGSWSLASWKRGE